MIDSNVMHLKVHKFDIFKYRRTWYWTSFLRKSSTMFNSKQWTRRMYWFHC